jgi:hypothetical protein
VTRPGIFGPFLMFKKGTGDVGDGEAEIHDRGDNPKASGGRCADRPGADPRRDENAMR